MVPNLPPRTAFILAGGSSRRMGQDKSRLPWGGGTLLEHMVERLGRVADTVRVAGRDPLPDRHPGRGPVEGIRTALGATATEENLIVAVDLPFLEPGFLEYMMDRLDRSRHLLVACELDGRVPLCLALRKGLLPTVEACLERGQRSLEGLVRSVDRETITETELGRMGFAPDMFRNLNTYEEYEKARRSL